MRAQCTPLDFNRGSACVPSIDLRDPTLAHRSPDLRLQTPTDSTGPEPLADNSIRRHCGQPERGSGRGAMASHALDRAEGGEPGASDAGVGLAEAFERAAAHATTLPAEAFDDDEKLDLYAWFKIATAYGNGAGPPSARPPIWRARDRAKHDAWAKHAETMTPAAAMRAYVELVAGRTGGALGAAEEIPSTEDEEGEAAAAAAPVPGVAALDEAQEASESLASTTGEGSPHPQQPQRSTRRRPRPPTAAPSPPPTRHHAPARPFGDRLEGLSASCPFALYPRKRLDLTYADLLFGLKECCGVPFSSRPGAPEQGEEGFVSLLLPGGKGWALPCLSVRTGWDLLLRALALPPGSEVLITGVTIPDMVKIVRRHGLVPVPLDLDPTTLTPSLEDLEAAAGSSKARVLVLTHLFGARIPPSLFGSLVAAAKRQGLLVVEDCAQAFFPTTSRAEGKEQEGQGRSGSGVPDLSFYSFGTIKTATALSGGVVVVHAPDDEQPQQEQQPPLRGRPLFDRLRRLERSLPIQQPTSELLFRLVRAGVLHALSTPAASGLLAMLLGPANYDRQVTRWTRGFPAKDDAELLRLLRRRPHPAVLALLQRRLVGVGEDPSYLLARSERGRALAALLQPLVEQGRILLPASAPEVATHGHWLFPVIILPGSPQEEEEEQEEEEALLARVAAAMRRAGFDVTRGATQLGCVEDMAPSSSAPSSSKTPRCRSMMRRILYLPCTPEMPPPVLRRMAAALAQALNPALAIMPTAPAPRSAVRQWGVPVVLAGLFLILPRWLRLLLPLLLALAVLYLYPRLVAYLSKSQGLTPGPSPLLSSMVELEAEETEKRLRELDATAQGQQQQQHGAEAEGREGQKAVVLLTGATGFVGHVVLADLLREREKQQPSGHYVIDKVVLLLRPSPKQREAAAGGVTARLSELRALPIFAPFVASGAFDQAVVAVAGDVSRSQCGVSAEEKARLQGLGITHVVHCAASVLFDQPLAEAAAINVGGALRIQALARSLGATCQRFIHVSTAFVHPRPSSASSSLPETLVALGEEDPQALYHSATDGTQWLAARVLKRGGWPNTYTFTKAMAEHLLARRCGAGASGAGAGAGAGVGATGQMDLRIVRPAIVGPAWQYPQPGYLGQKPSTLSACLVLRMTGLLRVFPMGPQPAAVVPVDVVARAVVAQVLDGPASSTPNPVIRHAIWAGDSQPEGLTWQGVSQLYYRLAHLRGQVAALPAALFLAFVTHAPKLPLLPFPWLHGVLNALPLRLLRVLGRLPPSLQGREALIDRCLNLPLAYTPFMCQSWRFASALRPPPSFHTEEYLIRAIMECERFLLKRKQQGRTQQLPSGWISPTAQHGSIAAMAQCLARPHGSLPLRCVAWLCDLLLPRCFAGGIHYHMPSFARGQRALMEAQAEAGESSPSPVLVLAPTHRSYADFVLLSYLRFHHPESAPGLSTKPQLIDIAAADDAFGGQGPWSGLLAALGAFFVRRNRGPGAPPDPELQAALQRLLASSTSEPLVLEVFLEGTRSRDRRVKQPPRTGLLRCLLAEAQACGRPVVILPLAMSYEGVPEQASLAAELKGPQQPSLGGGGVGALLRWGSAAFMERVQLGSVWVKAGEPITFLPSPSTPAPAPVLRDAAASLAQAAQQAQRRALVITEGTHVAAAVADLPGLEAAALRCACQALGLEVVEAPSSSYPLPSDPTERWMLHLQWAGALGPLVARAGLPEWGAWLMGGGGAAEEAAAEGVKEECAPVTAALVNYLSQVAAQVEAAVGALYARGFSCPTPAHVAQHLSPGLPTQLVTAAVGMLAADHEGESKAPPGLLLSSDGQITAAGGAASEEEAVGRADRDCALAAVEDQGWEGEEEEQEREEGDPDAEAFGAWGFRDSRFVVLPSSPPTVMLTGKRYPLSGRPLPGLLPFFSRELGVPLAAHDAYPPRTATPRLPAPALTAKALARLRALCPSLSTDPRDRARHGTGHALEDMVALRLGKRWRMPDAVARPATEGEVAALVHAAAPAAAAAASEDGGLGLCLVPFGGGTNVSLMLRAPSWEEEPRPIVSVDLRAMNRVLWLDEEHGVAEIEAGATGREIEAALAGMGAGWTMGHEPDSYEFSTLGGWVATKASGMKRGRYGNIEDIVLGVTMVTASGAVVRHGHSAECQACHSRVSEGLDFKHLALGSEGGLGTITRAIVRVRPLPECVEYDSALFPDMATGVAFMRSLVRAVPPGSRPASVRLMDNTQFRMGRVLVGEGGGHDASVSLVHRLGRAAKGLYVTWWKGIDPAQACAATFVFEGRKEEVQSQRAAVARLVASSTDGGRAFMTGAAAGKAGYELTLGIAYLRDFGLSHRVLGESLEAFVPWSQVEAALDSVREAARAAHAALGLEGQPMVTSRVTQLYDEGVCLYVYVAIHCRALGSRGDGGVGPYKQVEGAVRSALLGCGASLSHHHGVGKCAKAGLLRERAGPGMRGVMAAVKEALDPHNVFGARNGLLLPPSGLEKEQACVKNKEQEQGESRM